MKSSVAQHPGWHPLHAQPAWQAADLGQPLPNDPHAVSVALPLWRDVVGYEEDEPRVHDALQSGYPRFVLPPLLKQLQEWVLARGLVAEALQGPGSVCWPYRRRVDAEAALAYIATHATAEDGATPADAEQAQAELLATEEFGFFAVWSNAEASAAAKAYWQHSGAGLSTRGAAMILDDGVIVDDVGARTRVRRVCIRSLALSNDEYFYSQRHGGIYCRCSSY